MIYKKKITCLFLICFFLSIIGCARLSLNKAIEVNSIKSYNDFLDEYSDSPYAHEAEKRRELLRFNQAESQNTVKVYDIYLKEYPNGKFLETVNTKREIARFNQAESQNTVEAYDIYLKEYPNGKFLETVNTKRDIAMFNQTESQNTVEAFDIYLKEYPNGKFLETVNNKRELARLNEVKKRNSIEQCNVYLKEYTEGKFTYEVKRLLKKLVLDEAFTHVTCKEEKKIFIVEDIAGNKLEGTIPFSIYCEKPRRIGYIYRFEYEDYVTFQNEYYPETRYFKRANSTFPNIGFHKTKSFSFLDHTNIIFTLPGYENQFMGRVTQNCYSLRIPLKTITGENYTIPLDRIKWPIREKYKRPFTGWNRVFGGSQSDRVSSIQQSSDGGFIVAGDTESKGSGRTDGWIIKLNKDGNIEWDKSFGDSKDNYIKSIQQTNDGGFIVAGFYPSKYWIFKITSKGIKEWDSFFGGGKSRSKNYTYAHSIKQTTDGGYIVAGKTNSKGAGGYDIWVIKLNKNGLKEWDSIFGKSTSEDVKFIQQTKDGGYIVAGLNNSFDNWLIKLNKKGIKEWDKTFEGAGRSFDDYSIQQTSDEGYVIAGFTGNRNDGRLDFRILKLNKHGGNLESIERITRIPLGSSDNITSIQPTNDGGYVLAGSTTCKGSGDFLVFKLNKDGQKEWYQTFGMPESQSATSVKQSDDGGYIVAGNTHGDIWVIKLDKNGNTKKIKF